jgi:ParB family chromosome partitioning protein
MHRLDMVSREFTEEQAERYDELAELHEAEALDAEGEKELTALEDYTAPFYSDAQRKLSGVFVYVGNNGEIKASSAYVAAEHVQAAIEAGVLAPVNETEVKETPKPAYSQKFIDDMVAIRLAAVQTALLDKPDYLLSLFAFYATPASGLTCNLFGFGYGGAERNTPEVDDQFILDPRLGGEQDAAAEAAYDQFHEMAAKGSVEAFKAFAKSKKGAKNEAMHKLFNDPEHQAALGVTEAQKTRIDAWVPDCF